MRFVCEECGEAYEDKQPSANVEATSVRPWNVYHSRGPHFAAHACRPRRSDEPGSLFDRRPR